MHAANVIKRTLPQGRKVLRVCIVGAGVAGLRAADVLLQHGAQVTIYEGRNRVGGRLGQSNQLGHPVDLGPNWIHGTDNNPILNLAIETDTKLHYWGERQAEYDDKGHRQPDEDVTHRGELFWGIIADAFKYSRHHTATIPSSMSLMDFVKTEAATKFNDLPSAEAERQKTMLIQEAEMWGAFVGSPVHRQSLKFFWLEECIEGENPFVAETYAKILNRIAQPAVEKAKIEFGTMVTAITSSEDDDGAGVVINTDKGQKDTYDEIIVTSPLGWLKRNKSLFNPPLPQRLSQAIDSIGYGSLDKVYITFPSAFWDVEEQPPATSPPPPSTSNRNTAPNTTATTTPLHQHPSPSSSSSSPTTAHYPGFTHFLAPTYTRTQNPHAWPQQCLSLSALPQPCAQPTLLFYIFDACATHVATNLAGSPTALADFFAPYIALLPNYSPSDPACTPTSALATAWAADPLAGFGSYSNFQVGLERAGEDVEVMRFGAPERRVWMAGEHTSPFEALGTVTGAYWAGERVAERIVEAYAV